VAQALTTFLHYALLVAPLVLQYGDTRVMSSQAWAATRRSLAEGRAANPDTNCREAAVAAERIAVDVMLMSRQALNSALVAIRTLAVEVMGAVGETKTRVANANAGPEVGQALVDAYAPVCDAVGTDERREALTELFSGMARGRAAGLGRMMGLVETVGHTLDSIETMTK
jgi:hypothetical protein